MENHFRTASCVLLFAMLAGTQIGCTPEEPELQAQAPVPVPKSRVISIDHPAPAGAAEASLLASTDLSLLMSWVENTGPTASLRFARWQSGRWSQAREIASGEDWFVNWADFPAMAEDGDGRLYAHWLEKEAESTYAYGIRLSRSDDSGLNWSDPLTPHDDGTPTEHGFVSYFTSNSGQVGMAWLDGRNTEEGSDGERGAMTLRAGLVGEDAVENWEVDSSTCDCCQTDAVATPSGAVVVYRDRGEDEVRDISIVRQVDGMWLAPQVVAADGWHIAACPVNGPGVAAHEEQLAVAWFTMADGEPAVKLARSVDQGSHFDPPIRIDTENSMGRVDLAWLANGDLVVSYLVDQGEQAVVRLARVVDGAVTERLDLGVTSPARSSGFPRMAVIGSRLFVVWRELDETIDRLKLAEIQFDAVQGDGSS
jgi:hypothetical protein